MQLKINKMEIRNFMGIKELNIDFHGKNATISGENGTGKTTIKTAFSWVLFDKNTFGETKFGIKPVDAAGNPIHNLETLVEVEFDIDGTTTTYKRTMTEKWTRKRGEATATFTGNENSYFINGIPKKKTEYNAAVKELISEDVFKTITDPIYFNEQIDWKTRRKILMEICGEISDEEVIESDPDLSILLTILPTRRVEEHAEILKSSMKKINAELGLIPAKIDEAERAIPDLSQISADAYELESLERRAEELRAKKSEIQNGAELIELRAKAKALEAKAESIRSPFPVYETAEYQKITDIQGYIASEALAKANEDKAVKDNQEKIDAICMHKKHLSEKWDSVSAVTFTGDTCPTCGQFLPPDQVEEKRKKFNADKAAQLDEIERQLESDNEELKKAQKSLSDHENSAKKLQDSINAYHEEKIQLEERMKQLEAAHKSAQDKEIAAVRAEIARVNDEIANYGKSIDEKVKAVENEIESVSAQYNVMQSNIALQKTAERQKKRIAELQEEQVMLSNQYMANEREVYLCEQFTRRKVDMLNEKINSHFKVARFKLFDVQVNGGLAETCEVTYRGVPYQDLNHAARVNVGLDIINTLSRTKDVYGPIFIDNAEACNNFIDTDSQIIKLYVSKDPQLKIEIGE